MMTFPLIVLAVLTTNILGLYFRQLYVKKHWIKRLTAAGFHVLSIASTLRRFPLDNDMFQLSIRVGVSSYPFTSFYAVKVQVNEGEPFFIMAAVRDYWYKFEVVYKDRALPKV